MKTSRKIRKLREDPTLKLARTIGVPKAKAGDFRICDAPNPTAGQNTTVRRLTRIEQMAKAGLITPDQAQACEWYADNHCRAYDEGQGTTANYGGVGGGGGLGWDHGARSLAQREARDNIDYARLAIPSHLLGVFEAITLGTGRPIQMLPKTDRLRFSQAAWHLHGQIAHLLAIAA